MEPDPAQPSPAATGRSPAELVEGLRRGEKLDRKGAPLRGADLAECDLSKLDLSRADLSEADLSGADLSGAVLTGASLRGATLCRAVLDGAELLGADLGDANLDGCHAERAGFGGADLRGARLNDAALGSSTLSHAKLAGAQLRCADLHDARLREADLERADFHGADLRGADFTASRVAGACFDRSDLRGARLAELSGFESARWISVDIRDSDFRGGIRLRRHIMDENFIQEFRSRSRGSEVLYKIWWLTSDCGRSFGRFGLWVGVVLLLFAGLYQLVDVDYGDHPTPLSPFYYSVVTMTTLGYGDVLPASTGAQIVAILQVCIGYLALGGLISIFANKMARRAE